MKNKKWVALFSQTGSEILRVSELLGKVPDKIITNQPITSPRINPELIKKYSDRIVVVPSTPTNIDYRNNLTRGDVITLHGWLRIIPSDVCNDFCIYNSHPGLVTPESEGGYGELLRGKDPQLRAHTLGLKTSGCVIHKVIPAVDEGEILDYSIISIAGMTIEDTIKRLHEASINLWFKFLFDLFRER